MSSTIILLVEDHAPDVVAPALQQLLGDDIPGLRIDYAATVAEGHLRLAEYEAKDEAPYCAVLDFKLPKERIGEYPEMDPSLCREIRKRWPQLARRIIHISGYPNEEEIAKHVADVHLERFDARSAISKEQLGGWTGQVAKRIRQLYFGERIGDQIAELFPDAASKARIEPRRYRRGAVSGSITMPLLDLILEIGAHWGDLDTDLQSGIRKIFDIDESSTPPGVALKLDEVIMKER